MRERSGVIISHSYSGGSTRVELFLTVWSKKNVHYNMVYAKILLCEQVS